MAINGQAQQGRYPATRMGVEDVIREAFNNAKIYKAEWDAYDAKKTGKDIKQTAKDLGQRGKDAGRAVGQGCKSGGRKMQGNDRQGA